MMLKLFEEYDVRDEMGRWVEGSILELEHKANARTRVRVRCRGWFEYTTTRCERCELYEEVMFLPEDSARFAAKGLYTNESTEGARSFLERKGIRCGRGVLAYVDHAREPGWYRGEIHGLNDQHPFQIQIRFLIQGDNENRWMYRYYHLFGKDFMLSADDESPVNESQSTANGRIPEV